MGYPRRQKEAALRFLQAHKEALRLSLGYKRLGWDPIRKRIMEPYETGADGKRSKIDDRLYRQVLEGWEKGAEISDDLFYLIDSYLRRLAVESQDKEAMRIRREWEFKEQASVLAKMYLPLAFSEFQFWEYNLPWKQPWTAYSDAITGTWFKSIIFKSDISHLGIARLLVGYLPCIVGEIDNLDGANIVVFEGFLIPSGLVIYADKGQDRGADALIKLLRPAFRGLTTLGSAEGKLRLRPSSKDVTSFPIADLDYPSPVICPTIGVYWEALKYFNDYGLPMSSVSPAEEGQPFQQARDLPVDQLHKLPVKFDGTFDSEINSVLELSYKGYVY